LRKEFVERAGAVKLAAADALIGDEEMNIIAQRLFDAAQAPPEDYAPLMPGAAGARGAGRAEDVAYADYRLSPERVERERQVLGKWFENVRALFEGADEARGKGPEQDRIRRLLDETFVMYRNLVVALSNLKGLTRISGAEAVRLEELRRTFRRELCGLESLAAMRRLDELAAGLPEGAPGAKVLRAEALRLSRAFEALLAYPGADPESVRSAARMLYELRNAADFWAFRLLVHRRLLKLKAGIEGRGFSCVWDRLIFGYLSRFFPSADYVREAAALSARGKIINAALEGVAAGDSDAASVFAGAGKPLLEQIAEAEAGVMRLRSYSGLNRKLQFVFWDALVNPLGLRPGPKGISAGIRP
jgi:hypothetical protein